MVSLEYRGQTSGAVSTAPVGRPRFAGSDAKDDLSTPRVVVTPAGGSSNSESEEAFYEALHELRLQAAAGELDQGEDDYEADRDAYWQRSMDELPARMSARLRGESIPEYIPGKPSRFGTCLYHVCSQLGYDRVDDKVTRVSDIPEHILLSLRRESNKCKVHYVHYGPDDARNHVQRVPWSTKTSLVSASLLGADDEVVGQQVTAVVNLENFFLNSPANKVAHIRFFATEDDGFGKDVEGAFGTSSRRPREETSLFGGRQASRSASVVDDYSSPGRANVSGGVTRAAKRVVRAKAAALPGVMVKKSYVASKSVMFNNLSEMFLDSISREFAQEIIEAVFTAWGIPFGDKDAVKYAEDLIWGFIVAATASNKADYDRTFEVPTATGPVDASFQVFSNVLESQFGVSRRQFSRGVSDDIRAYLKEPENLPLLPVLATRAGCENQMADLVFDGSTHCSGMVSTEITFTKLLQARGLFEDESATAVDASARLMQGISTGTRAKVGR